MQLSLAAPSYRSVNLTGMVSSTGSPGNFGGGAGSGEARWHGRCRG